MGTFLCPEFISSVPTTPHERRPQSYSHFPRCFQHRTDVIREARESEPPGTRARLPGLPSWCNNSFSPSSPAPWPNFPHLQNWVPAFFLANKHLSPKTVSKIPSQPQLRVPGILRGEAGLQRAGSEAPWEVPAVGARTWPCLALTPSTLHRASPGLTSGPIVGWAEELAQAPETWLGDHELLLPDTSEW